MLVQEPRQDELLTLKKTGPEHEFTSIREIAKTFLKDKKVWVKNEMVPDADLLLAAVAGNDDDDMQCYQNTINVYQ